MTSPVLALASVILGLAALFVLWPLVRPQDPEEAVEPGPASSLRTRLKGEVEEVELDASSGRIDPDEASRRLDELRRELGMLPR